MSKQPGSLHNAWTYPFFAPLSAPMVCNLLSCVQKEHQQWSEEEVVGRTLEAVQLQREAVWLFLHPYVTTSALSSKDIFEILQHQVKWSVPQRTLNNWKLRGWWRSDTFGKPNPDASAALLIFFLVLKSLGISACKLAGTLSPEEPHFWCYRMHLVPQQEPFRPVPCPVPLPRDLPAASLLCLPWPTWAVGWQRVGGLIAVRFAGIERASSGERPFRWSLGEEEFRVWEQTVHALAPVLQESVGDEREQTSVGMERQQRWLESIDAEIRYSAQALVLNKLAATLWHQYFSPAFTQEGLTTVLQRIRRER